MAHVRFKRRKLRKRGPGRPDAEISVQHMRDYSRATRAAQLGAILMPTFAKPRAIAMNLMQASAGDVGARFPAQLQTSFHRPDMSRPGRRDFVWHGGTVGRGTPFHGWTVQRDTSRLLLPKFQVGAGVNTQYTYDTHRPQKAEAPTRLRPLKLVGARGQWAELATYSPVQKPWGTAMRAAPRSQRGAAGTIPALLTTPPKHYYGRV